MAGRFLAVSTFVAILWSQASSGLAQITFIEPPALPTGTARISGVVLTDTGAPAGGARVSLLSPCERDCYRAREITTDDTGRFVMTGVPSLALSIEAVAPGFAKTTFGAAGPGLPGTPVRLDPDERLDVVLRLSRGATLRGFVFDARGLPASGIHVYAFRLEPIGDGEDLMGEGGKSITDTRGEFDISDLPPGKYMLGGFRMWDPAPRQPVQKLPSGEEALESGAYYPNADDWDSSERLVLGPGEFRPNLILRLRLETVTEIRGVVRGPDQKPFAGAYVRAQPRKGQPFTVSDANTAADGTFALPRIKAGEYDVVAFSRPGVPLWAGAISNSDGRSPASIILDLQPAGTVTGRVRFEGATLGAADLHVFLNRLPVSVAPVGYVMSGTPLEFSFQGVPPGRYRLSASPNRGEWRTRSITVDGQDVLDSWFEMVGTAQRDVLVTLTDRVSELNGTVRNADRRPYSGCTLVVFPPDRKYWTIWSSRVRAIRPDTKGRFSIRNLPAGEYLVAQTGADLYGIPDHAGLSVLMRDATRVTVPEEGTVTLDLVASSGSGLPYARASQTAAHLDARRQPVRANGAPALQAR